MKFEVSTNAQYYTLVNDLKPLIPYSEIII